MKILLLIIAITFTSHAIILKVHEKVKVADISASEGMKTADASGLESVPVTGGSSRAVICAISDHTPPNLCKTCPTYAILQSDNSCLCEPGYRAGSDNHTCVHYKTPVVKVNML